MWWLRCRDNAYLLVLLFLWSWKRYESPPQKPFFGLQHFLELQVIWLESHSDVDWLLLLPGGMNVHLQSVTDRAKQIRSQIGRSGRLYRWPRAPDELLKPMSYFCAASEGIDLGIWREDPYLKCTCSRGKSVAKVFVLGLNWISQQSYFIQHEFFWVWGVFRKLSKVLISFFGDSLAVTNHRACFFFMFFPLAFSCFGGRRRRPAGSNGSQTAHRRRSEASGAHGDRTADVDRGQQHGEQSLAWWAAWVLSEFFGNFGLKPLHSCFFPSKTTRRI